MENPIKMDDLGAPIFGNIHMFWIFVWTLVEVTSLSPFLLFAISDQNLLYGITSHFQQSESRENYRSEAKVNQKS